MILLSLFDQVGLINRFELIFDFDILATIASIFLDYGRLDRFFRISDDLKCCQAFLI